MTTKDLDQLCKQTLIDGLHAPLKASIDRLLALGESKARILQGVQRSLPRYRYLPQAGKMTLLAVEAYLEAKP